MDNKTLLESVANKLDISAAEAAELQSSLAEVIAEALLDSDIVAIPSFGNLESKKRLERVSVHPASGKRLLIPPKIVAAFRPSAILKQRIASE